MKAKIEISEDLLKLIQEEAGARHMTVERVIEGGLYRLRYDRLALLKKAELKRRAYANDPLPPLPTFDTGGALVDIDDKDAMYRALDEERDIRLYGVSLRDDVGRDDVEQEGDA